MNDELSPEFVQQVNAIELPLEGVDYFEAVELFKMRIILVALMRTQGVKVKAARILRMNRPTLVSAMRTLGFPLNPAYRKKDG